MEEGLLNRVSINPDVCGGVACIAGTRIPVSIVLGGFAEGLSPEEIIEHFPNLTRDDVLAAAAYGAKLAQENVWKLAG